MKIDRLIRNLRGKLQHCVVNNPADVFLFSGGLDTSILALLYKDVAGINVGLENYSSDIKYAKLVEEFLNIKVYYQSIKIEEAIDSITEIVKILKSFDPAIPNDITVYFGLKFAKSLGVKSIMTGDGSDELFAGYDYMQNMYQLNKYIRRMARSMYFNSNEIGKYLGIEIKQPYLDKEFRGFSLEIPINLKIRKEKNKIFGKWILRKAFEDDLPAGIIWQNKRPLEYGSGMTKLREIISEKISDREFEAKKKQYKIKFINKEHSYYYEIYRKVVGEIPGPKENEKKCTFCNAGMNITSFHCKICGRVVK